MNQPTSKEQNSIIEKLKSYDDLTNFYKQRKWSIYLFVIFLIILIIYLIVCVYLSQKILWIFVIVPTVLLFIIPMSFNIISVNLLINKLNSKINENINELYQILNGKNLDKNLTIKFKFKKNKELYKKRTIFINQLYFTMSSQVINYLNNI
ncbi:hypothetical protein [Malacoplasma iowae]|uniref:Uncharacterized protein n=1 Tax=Malacoplasma iowae 695 TaxID=1048830 RepID=A0A6P1LE96_MALIO|nr:hypothetical protein [Malacoplasma iowae]VEU62381.1 Uncharacterised protein [Mycoplasmopsis fermentans]EGZ31468.1 hypothetical protein GUU_01817 [Malacoplasma iowae 695]QHG89799.1 hypothetical protein EER00_02780 [Malacoplasma iowae 695]WPL35398.1 hypothetical protein QX180_03630 [Malacoplasma iowae]WPL39718.1 hypothetical protein QX183_04165 [Malacoplasma iowae]